MGIEPLIFQSIMKNTIPRYLYFSRLERAGTAALLVMALAAFCFPALVVYLKPVQPVDFSAFEKAASEYYAALDQRNEPEPVAEPFFFDPNQANESEFGQLGLSSRVAQSIIRYREKGGRFKKATDFKKIYLLSAEDYERLEPWIKIGVAQEKRSVYASSKNNNSVQVFELFEFDPNKVGEEELLQLGMPRAAARSVVAYRNKGGLFRKKEDLKKIYTLPEDVYATLEPYIQIEAMVPENKPATRSFTAPGKAALTVIDANLASLSDWQNLPGIGAWRAQQIVAYRERLGGFVKVAQVAEVKSMPDSIYQQIKPYVSISGGFLQKIDLNTATVEDLKAHPYFFAKQARLIVNYREQHGPFRSVDELLKLSAVVDAAWLERVGAYLECGLVPSKRGN